MRDETKANFEHFLFCLDKQGIFSLLPSETVLDLDPPSLERYAAAFAAFRRQQRTELTSDEERGRVLAHGELIRRALGNAPMTERPKKSRSDITTRIAIGAIIALMIVCTVGVYWWGFARDNSLAVVVCIAGAVVCGAAAGAVSRLL